MNAAELAPLIGSAVALIVAVMTLRASSKANATNDRKVDLEEHRDAIDRLKKIIEDQDRHFERVRTQLDRVQDQLAREVDASAALRSQIYKLQDQVDELGRSRARLETLLATTRKQTADHATLAEDPAA